MSLLKVGVLVTLASLVQVQGVGGEGLLPPPRNVTLVPKDFSLFLTWLPLDVYPSRVFYTVQWRNAFNIRWSTVEHCRNISITSCNITCVYPELSNRYQVQVQALARMGLTSVATKPENIDYSALVDLAPPILHMRPDGNTLLVKSTSSYPSCLKSIFQELTYDLEFWEAGTEEKMRFSNVMADGVAINMTTLAPGYYCLRAQAFFPPKMKRSNFSDPVCRLLREEGGHWKLAAPLLLIPFALLAGIAAFFYCYRKMVATFKMPQALDFSSFKSPTRLLEFREREVNQANALICTGESVIPEKRRRPVLQRYLPAVHSMYLQSREEEDDEDDDDDDDDDYYHGGFIPYTEMLRFQTKVMNRPMIGKGQESPDLSSESECSQLDGRCSPTTIMSKPFVWTEWGSEEANSGFQERKRTSLSEGSSVEHPLVFPVGYPAFAGEEQEVARRDMDFLLHCSDSAEGPDFHVPIRGQFMAVKVFLEGHCGGLEESQVPLLGIQSTGKDSCGLCFDVEELEDEKQCENDSSGCGSLMGEQTLWKGSSRDCLGSKLLGDNRDLRKNNDPSLAFHGYQPKPTHYILRT